MKKILILFLSLALIGCSSNDEVAGSGDEKTELKGFKRYEGTWGPVSYIYKGVEHLCNPNYPDINNIDRVIFLPYQGQEIILRTEYYYHGEWKHGRDITLFYIDGLFYKKLNGGQPKAEDIFDSITLSDGFLYYTECPGVKFKKVN